MKTKNISDKLRFHTLKGWYRFAILIVCLMSSMAAFAQEQIPPPVEMADALRTNGKIYVVVTCIAVIFTCLLIFLIMMERKVKKLENMLNNK